MDAKELLQYQIDDAGYQLDKAFEGYPEDLLDRKHPASTFTARETLIHLAEAYTATVKTVRGEKHEWGTYAPEDRSFSALVRDLKQTRQEAISAGLSAGSDHIKTLHMFVVGHDYYHVGQICAMRLDLEPGWDAYSIYRF